MKETPRRRITVLSSLDEIFMYQLGIMVGVILRPPYSFLQQASGQIFKDDVKFFLQNTELKYTRHKTQSSSTPDTKHRVQVH
jgi:hypothetical protein